MGYFQDFQWSGDQTSGQLSWYSEELEGAFALAASIWVTGRKGHLVLLMVSISTQLAMISCQRSKARRGHVICPFYISYIVATEGWFAMSLGSEARGTLCLLA